MICANWLAIEALDDIAIAPFLAKRGHLPPSQTPAFARAITSGRLLAFEFLRGGERIGYVLLQVRKLILAEAFHGPVVLESADYTECVAALKPLLRKRGLLLLRVLPPLYAPRPDGLPGGFNWATSVVDISKDEAALLQSFSPNHRQSIRKGMAAPVAIEALENDEALAFAEGYAAMFARRGIQVSASETVRLLTQFSEEPDAFALCALQAVNRKLIGGGIFLHSGDTCTYYQGWSARTPHPVLHTLLWMAMLHAKSLGCSRFDLGGYSLDKRDAQLQAINDFKRWFRGTVISYPATSLIPLFSILTPLLRSLGKRL